MRMSHVLFTGCALAIGAASVGYVAAEETRNMGIPQKVIAQPFLDGIVGTYTTSASMTHDGKEGKGTGRSTYVKGIGGTALIQEYELNASGPDGKPMRFFGHGVTKLSDDGKTATTWWFCNMSPDVMKLTGPVTDSTLELSGQSPQGGEVTISLKRTPEGGILFNMKEGANEMTDVYTRAK